MEKSDLYINQSILRGKKWYDQRDVDGNFKFKPSISQQADIDEYLSSIKPVKDKEKK